MKRFFLIFLIILVAGSALAQGSVNPQVRTGKWDFSVQTRYVGSQDKSNDNGSSLSFEDDLGFGFGFGYNFNEKFNLGFAMSWRSIAYNATAVGFEDPDNNFSYNGTMDTSTMQVTGRWTPLTGTFTPYVNGGIGWMALDSNIYAGSDGYCWYDPWWGYVCGTYSSTYGTDAAAYELGVGLDIKLTPQLFVRIGYDRGWVDLDSYDGSDMFRLDFGGLF